MRPALHDRAAVEHRDLVGVAHRREAVSDHDRRAALGQPLERLADGALGLHVERARGLVEHEHRRVAQDGAGDRDPLALAAGEAEAALADDGVVALGQRRDRVVDLGGARRLLDLLVGRIRPREAQVLAHRGVEEVGLLRDDADRVGQRAEPQLAQVGAVEPHGAALGVVQAGGEVAERRLARAVSPTSASLRAGRHRRGRRRAASSVVART